MVLRRRRGSDSHGHGRICQFQNPSPEELDYQPICLQRQVAIRNHSGPHSLMRICWSSDSSTSIAGGGYLADGVWAGHKFDILDVDSLEDMDGQWEDVT
jgi:hypothetical protein